MYRHQDVTRSRSSGFIPSSGIHIDLSSGPSGYALLSSFENKVTSLQLVRMSETINI